EGLLGTGSWRKRCRNCAGSRWRRAEVRVHFQLRSAFAKSGAGDGAPFHTLTRGTVMNACEVRWPERSRRDAKLPSKGESDQLPTSRLFDHPISGGQERFRNGESERSGCIQVDYQL